MSLEVDLKGLDEKLVKNKASSDMIKLAAILSVVTAGIIILAKIFAYAMTDSLTVLASLTDSLLDIAASTINLVAVRFALLPASKKFRFGYSKAEDLAVFTQASFFALSGLFLIAQSIKRIIHPEPIQNSEVGIYVTIFAIIMTTGLVLYQRHVIKKTNSTIIKADFLHYVVDLATNFVVILSLFMSNYLPYVDPIFGLGIAIYILFGASSLLTRAMKNLMDHEMSDKDRQMVEKIIMSHPEILDVHDIKSRYAGSKLFLQFHIELDGEMKLSDAYKITEDIERELLAEFPNSEILIHKDPVGLEGHAKEFPSEPRLL